MKTKRPGRIAPIFTNKTVKAVQRVHKKYDAVVGTVGAMGECYVSGQKKKMRRSVVKLINRLTDMAAAATAVMDSLD